MASIMMGTIMWTRMLDKTRRALARMNWLGSCYKEHGVSTTTKRFRATKRAEYNTDWFLKQIISNINGWVCLCTICHLKSPLEGADGEQGQVLLFFCIPHQIHIHQLLELQGIKRENTHTLEPMKHWKYTKNGRKSQHLCVLQKMTSNK